MNGYKITLSSNTIYKEIELAPDVRQIKVGTESDCDIRLRKECFLGQMRLFFENNGQEWMVYCSDHLYFTDDNAKKWMEKTLVYGDMLEVRYQESGALLFLLEILPDFADEKQNYDRMVDISGKSSLMIGTVVACDIVLSGEQMKEEAIVLNREVDGFGLSIEHTTYGVYINGNKAKNGDRIKDGDFLSIANCSFYFHDNKIWTQMCPEIQMNSLYFLDAPSQGAYPKFNRNTRVKTVVCDEKIEILDPPAKPEKPKNNLFMRILPSVGMLIAAGIMAYFGGMMIIMSAISCTIAIFTTIVSIKEGKKDFKESSAARIEKYNTYITKKGKR